MDKLLSAIGYKRDESWSHERFVQSYDLLLLVTEGKLIYTVNHIPFELSEGALLYLPEGTLREGFPCPGFGHSKLAVRFKRLEWEDAKELSLLKSNKPYTLYTKKFHWFNTRLTELYNELKDQRAGFESISSGIFLEVLGAINREIAEQAFANSFEQQVYEYIREHYTLPLTIKQLAQMTGKSETYLITAFRQRFGEPPLSYMHRIRLNEACKLLTSTNLSVEAIALQLGYCDASYFYRMFRNRIGVSPSQFRKE